MQRTIKGIANVCLERMQGMIHIPLEADIIVLTDDGKREQETVSFLFALTFPINENDLQTKPQNNTWEGTKPERGDKTNKRTSSCSLGVHIYRPK